MLKQSNQSSHQLMMKLQCHNLLLCFSTQEILYNRLPWCSYDQHILSWYNASRRTQKYAQTYWISTTFAPAHIIGWSNPVDWCFLYIIIWNGMSKLDWRVGFLWYGRSISNITLKHTYSQQTDKLYPSSMNLYRTEHNSSKYMKLEPTSPTQWHFSTEQN